MRFLNWSQLLTVGLFISVCSNVELVVSVWMLTMLPVGYQLL